LNSDGCNVSKVLFRLNKSDVIDPAELYKTNDGRSNQHTRCE
jgi:hypothetical protein